MEFNVCCVAQFGIKRLKIGVQMVGQNAVLTSKNALELLSQKSISQSVCMALKLLLTFNHLHGMYTTLEWHANRINWKHSNFYMRKVLQKLLHKLH